MTDTAVAAGKVCLITGATAGIGLATARGLAVQGATVVIAGRSEEKCAATVERITVETGNPNVRYLVADLADQGQIRRLAGQVKERCERLHVLVNNAGISLPKRQESAEGIEMVFAVNHLAPFLLTNLLLDLLIASAPARIINVASLAHMRGRIDFDALSCRRGYRQGRAYARSKLANVLFTYELARRLCGTGVTANALHPGLVATNIGRGGGLRSSIKRLLDRTVGMGPEEGAKTSIYLATSPEVEDVSGKYFEKLQAVSSSPSSYDEALARKLWEVSANLTDGRWIRDSALNRSVR